MILISRNGKTTVITGWRAWLLGAIAVGDLDYWQIDVWHRL